MGINYYGSLFLIFLGGISMNQMIASQIKTLSESGLFLLYEDTIKRIGSHSAGGNIVPEYIKKQENILDLIQEEINNRKGGNNNL
jgi:hypothetical protein